MAGLTASAAPAPHPRVLTLKKKIEVDAPSVVRLPALAPGGAAPALNSCALVGGCVFPSSLDREFNIIVMMGHRLPLALADRYAAYLKWAAHPLNDPAPEAFRVPRHLDPEA